MQSAPDWGSDWRTGYGADEVEWRRKLVYLFRWPAGFSRKCDCQVPRELPAGVGGRENRMSGRKICVEGKSREEEEATAPGLWVRLGSRILRRRRSEGLQLAYLLCWLEKAAGSQRRPAGAGFWNIPMSCRMFKGEDLCDLLEKDNNEGRGARGGLLQSLGSD